MGPAEGQQQVPPRLHGCTRSAARKDRIENLELRSGAPNQAVQATMPHPPSSLALVLLLVAIVAAEPASARKTPPLGFKCACHLLFLSPASSAHSTPSSVLDIE